MTTTCVYILNQFLPTVPTFAVRETDVSRHNGGTSGALLKPLRDDSALTFPFSSSDSIAPSRYLLLIKRLIVETGISLGSCDARIYISQNKPCQNKSSQAGECAQQLYQPEKSINYINYDYFS